MKKLMTTFFVAIFILFIAGCDLTGEKPKESSSNHTSEPGSDDYIPLFDLKDQLQGSLLISGGQKITSVSQTIDLSNEGQFFTITPLKSELFEAIQKINEVSTKLQEIYDHSNIDTTNNQVSFTEGGLTVVDSTVNSQGTLTYLKYELDASHAFVKSIQKSSSVVVELTNTTDQFKLILTQGTTDLLVIDSNLSDTTTDVQFALGDETILLSIGKDALYQTIDLQWEQSEGTKHFYGYANSSYAAILLNYEAQSAQNNKIKSLSDLEVFNSHVGLIYKASSTTSVDQNGNEVVSTLGGYTLNMMSNWNSLQATNDNLTLHLSNGVTYDGNSNSKLIEQNGSNFIKANDGLRLVDFNNSLYNYEPFYVGGYFLEANYAFNQPYSLQVEELVDPSLFLISEYKSYTNFFLTKVKALPEVKPESDGKLQYRQVLSQGLHTDPNLEVYVLDHKNYRSEVVLLNSTSIPVKRYTSDSEFIFNNNLLIEYGKTLNKPFLKLQTINQQHELQELESYSLELVNHLTIKSIEFPNADSLTLNFTEGKSNHVNQLNISRTTGEYKVDSTEVVTTYTDRTTNTKVEIVKNVDDHILLLTYDENDQLVQISTGMDGTNMDVAITGYKIDGGRLILLGKNGLKPYFIQPVFTSEHRIDFRATLSYTYYYEGEITSIEYLENEENYEVKLKLSSNLLAKTIKVNREAEIVGELVKLGYLSDWSGWNPTDQRFRHLNFINYAFLGLSPSKDGTVIDTYSQAHKIKELKELNPEMRVMISLGGWGADYFSEAAMTDEHRKTFSRTTIEIMQKYGFDGIDIDWEYPGSSTAGISSSPYDKRNFTLMLKQVREDLDALSAQTGEKYYLTIAAGAFMGNGANVELTEIVKYLDFINIMTYDMEKWVTGGKNTSHHSNLYSSDKMTGQVGAHDYIRNFIRSGVPADKLTLGIAFYGRGAKDLNVAPENVFDQFFTSNQNVTISYSEIKKLLEDPSYVQYWDDAAKTPYIYNGNTFISYEDPRSIREKCDYAKEYGLRGVFFWQFSQDTTGELTEAIGTYAN